MKIVWIMKTFSEKIKSKNNIAGKHKNDLENF